MTSATGFPTAAVAEDAPLPSSLSSSKDGGSLQTNKENCENRKEDVEYESFQKMVESWSQHPENFEEDVMEHEPKNEEEEVEEEEDLANAAAEFFDRLPAITQKRLLRAIDYYEDPSTRLIKAADCLERDRQAHLRPDGGQPHQTGKDLAPYSLFKWFQAQVKYKKDSKKAHRVLDTVSVLHRSSASRLLDKVDDVDDDDVEVCMHENFRRKIESFLEQGGTLKRPATSIDYESRWGT